MPETSWSYHYWQPAPRWRPHWWLAKPDNPTMSPHALDKTGTRHTDTQWKAFEDYNFTSNIEKESHCIYVLPGLGLKYRLEYSRLSRSQSAEAALVSQLKYYKPRFTQQNKDVSPGKVRIYLTNIYRFFMREELFLDFVKVLSILSQSLHELFLKAKIKPCKIFSS